MTVLIICTECLRASRIHPEDYQNIEHEEKGIRLSKDSSCNLCKKIYKKDTLLYGTVAIPLNGGIVVGQNVNQSNIVQGDGNTVGWINVNYTNEVPTSITVNKYTVPVESAYWQF